MIQHFEPAPFRAPLWLRGGVVMTMAGARTRREPAALARHAEWQTLPGEGANRLRALVHRQARPDAPCVVLLHGLVGDVSSPYVVGAAAKAFARGFHVVRLNARNCGGTEDLAPDSYHGGITADLAIACESLVESGIASRIYLVGFSLGGNMALKLAGELGGEIPPWLAGVATLSPCIDFAAAAVQMNATTFGKLCQRRFLRELRRIVARREELHGREIDPASLRGTRTIREFDDRYTAPVGGFDGVDHYYREASGIRLMGRVRVPSLLIASRDDPLIPIAALERDEVRGNPALTLLATDHGGHVAFLGSRSSEPMDRHWGEDTVLRFCEALELRRGYAPPG